MLEVFHLLIFVFRLHYRRENKSISQLINMDWLTIDELTSPTVLNDNPL
ncbi:hypothetical protein IFVP177_C1330064 [Vibrio parahaemolyticus]